MSDETPKFDARLKDGVAYFEEMLKVMPDDRTTLEFLAVVYPQLGEAEKAKILATLKEAGGNRTRAAKMLGISRRTIYRKLDEYAAEGEAL